jgi:hypothetical protein
MKKSKLIIALVFGLLTISSLSNAQTGRFSVGAEVAIPMDDATKDMSSLGIGGSLRYEHPVGDKLGITLTAGYISYLIKDELEGFSFSSIPIQAGLKYYFQEQQSGFYAMAEVGVHASTAKVEFLGVSVSSSSTDISYAPEIGYMLDNFDIGLRYQMISTEGESSSYLGLRLAYVFGEK